MEWTSGEKLTITALVIGLGLLVWWLLQYSAENERQFTKVCDEARGVTVWDGRQYQCIKP